MKYMATIRWNDGEVTTTVFDTAQEMANYIKNEYKDYIKEVPIMAQFDETSFSFFDEELSSLVD